MTALLEQFGGLLAMQDHAASPMAEAATGMGWAGWILWLPIISMLLCGVCAAMRVRNKAPAWITVALLGLSFILTMGLYSNY